MISIASIQEYTNSLIPTPETDLRPKVMPADVQTFNPFAHKLGIIPAAINNKIASAIDTICAWIEKSTNEAQQEAEENLRWMELSDGEFPSEAVLEALDLAVNAANTMREEINNQDWKPEVNAFQWAKQAVLFRNPWEAFDFAFVEMQKSASCADGLVVLFEDAERVRDPSKALMQTNIRSNMVTMAKAVVKAVERDMDAEKDVNGHRPADVYRRWAKALRWIIRHEIVTSASRVLRELALEQSLPMSELDAPDWMDAYTGEVDMTIADRVSIKNPEAAEEDTMETIAVSYSEGFDDEDGIEESTYHTAAMAEASEWDVKIPMWMEMQEDLRPSDETRVISKDDALIHFRSAMKRTVQEMRNNGVSDVEDACREAMHAPMMIEDRNTGEMIASRNSHADLAIKALNRLAKTHDVKDIATIYLGLEHDFGFYETDARKIHVQGSLNNLERWLEVFGDELMESFTHDSLGTQSYDEHTEVVAFAEETILKIVEQAKADTAGQARTNVFHHPKFIEGFLRAMSNGSATTFKDTDGKWRSSGAKAGWEAWMESFNANAFQSYLKARLDGKDFETSKSAFWTATKQSKKVDTITSVTRDISTKVPIGLVLGSGRKIGWNILALKLKAGELIITDEQKTKLHKLLTDIGQAQVASLI